MSKKSTAPIKKRILIVDDHPMMRQGLAQLIGAEPDLSVCGEAENTGLELIKDFQVLQPGLPVLVISMHDESLYAERVLRAGGRGYIMKQEGGKKLMLAVRQVLGGKIYVSEKIS